MQNNNVQMFKIQVVQCSLPEFFYLMYKIISNGNNKQKAAVKNKRFKDLRAMFNPE